MSGSGSFKFFEAFEFVVVVDDLQGDWRAERFGLPDAGENIDGVLFKFLASTASVATLSQSQFVVDEGFVDRQSGGESIDQGDEGFAVRFTGGPVT